MANKHTMDLTRGSVFKKLILFAFPVCLSNLIQQLYHSADVIVVGNFAKDSTASLAAVGSTTQITNLLIHLFVGLSVGANVLCANRCGAKDKEGTRRVMHTAIPLAAICGIFISIVGFFLTRPLLELMGSPATVIDEATVYMKIIFLGQPASILYNFGAGILRAHGDTKRSMYILMTTGFVNVLLNLLFVIVFHLDAAGVALATIIAHYLSAGAILYILFHPAGEYCMRLSEIKVRAEDVKGIVKVGLPAGLNGIVYSLSNVIIVSTVNSLGDISVAATSASTSVSAIAHTVGSGFATACVSFSGQNFGAGNFKRIEKLYWYSVSIMVVFFIGVSTLFTLFPEFFLGLYTDNGAVIREGIPKLLLNNWGYVFCVVGEMANGCLRGLKRTGGPTFVNMFTVCGSRLIWVLLVFPFLPLQNLGTLCICYPISWFLSGAALMIYFFVVKHREEQKHLLSLKEENLSATPA